jgi:hypothetical protein
VQKAAVLEAQLYRAAQWVEATADRALAAEQRAVVVAAQASAIANPESEPARTAAPKLASATPILEYPSSERICRVCGRAAPPPSAKRRGGLRVCRRAECRQEARRRDNIAKQRRYRAEKLKDIPL